MSRRDRLSLGLSLLLTLFIIGLLGAWLAQPVPAYPISPATPRFEADRALADAVTLATAYPDRVVGSPTSARAREWISGRFAEIGLSVETLPFTVTVASEARAGVQVWATAPGETDEIILITAHYDVPQTGIPGAADDASGIGTLLELARVLAAEPHHRTYIFMASDSEEYGSFWGAKNFIERFINRAPNDPLLALISQFAPAPAQPPLNVVAVLDLDYLSARDLKRINLSSVGLRRGYTPLWMRQIGLGSIEAAGAQAAEADGALEYLYRAVPIGAADYAAYLRAGVAAINFGGEPTDPENWLAEYHTAQDTPDKLTAPAFAAYGRAAEIFVRSMDELAALPANTQTYWRLDHGRYLTKNVLDLLQLLVFAPLFLATFWAWRAARPRWDELQPELTGFLALVIIGLDGYAVAYSLVRLDWLPGYEMFPASPRDPFLLQPTWWAVAVIYGTMAFMAWYSLRPFRGWARLADVLKIPHQHRRLTLLLLLSGLILVVWFLNGFAASGLLSLAAYAWIWIEPHEQVWRKGLNVVLGVAGALPFAGVVYFFAANFPIGPWWWYLTLGAAYGLFPIVGVVAFCMALALLLRFVQYGLRDE